MVVYGNYISWFIDFSICLLMSFTFIFPFSIFLFPDINVWNLLIVFCIFFRVVSRCISINFQTAFSGFLDY